MKTRKFRGLVAVTAASTLLLAACGGDEDPVDDAGDVAEDVDGSDDSSEMEADDEMTDGEMAEEDMESALTMEPVGEACSAIPADGEGSSEGMADDPVGTAASNNPVLSTLVAAVDAAGLVDTVNSSEALTVFAPFNGAFDAFSEEELNGLLADTETLTAVLTLHVVGEQQLDAAALLETGDVTTLAGANLNVSGSLEEGVTVTGPSNSANVICANVQTANATVHIIDTVLMPAA